MKPEHFIREYGVEKAREVVEGAPEGHKGYNDVIKQYTRGVWFSRDVLLSDLKRLVESLDIISDLDGIDAAKGTLAELIKLDWDEFEHRWIDNWMCTRQRLESAIKDHESIYGGGDEIN
ncbi:hypothetical protein [Acinetobacter nosocomialis]|uniref:hypothetical protein n=1 Tax=Acinetobacter nosocomialis TaxID=106654 RepID=UPI0012503018|nr:hypothetical protein [Acinetobacter nosocomialis]